MGVDHLTEATHDHRSRLSIVGLVDILGIRDLMKTDYSTAADTIEALQDHLAGTIKKFPKLGIEIRSFSDSVFMLKPTGPIVKDSKGDFIEFCAFVSALMSDCLQGGIPLRGAISVGMVITDPRRPVPEARFLSGRPIWEVVDWEGKQDWVGVSFVPAETIRQYNTLSAFCDRAVYCEHVITALVSEGLVAAFAIPNGAKTSAIQTVERGPDKGPAPGTKVNALCWPKEDLGHLNSLLEQVVTQIGNENLQRKYANARKFIQEQMPRPSGVT